MEKVKEYSNGEITVVWKPEKCIHSAKCVHSLSSVFKPKEKPWVQMEHASSEEIKKAIDGCPSGALGYYSKDDSANKEGATPVNEPTKVEVIDGGPLMVHGNLEITHADGNSEQRKRATAFCRCGKSNNTPFCDGSHNA